MNRLSSISAVIILFAFAATCSAQTWFTNDSAYSALVGFGGAVIVHGDEIFVSRTGLSARFPEPPSQVGGVHIFALESDGWIEQMELRPSDGEFSDDFGHAMAASGDVLVIGAPLRNNAAGAIYVFERSDGGDWLETAVLSDGLASKGDSLGWSLDLEGNTLIVGSPGYRDDAGRATVLQRNPVSREWTNIVDLRAAPKPGDLFGASISLGPGGVVVGAPGTDDGSGKIYGWGLDAESGLWVAAGQMGNPDTSSSAFGYAVGLQDAVVAASAPIGSAAVYVINWVDPASWDSPSILVATDSALMTSTNSARSGFGAALAFNREELWVGAPSGGEYGGIAVFEFDAYRSSWTMSQSLVPYRLSRGAAVGNPLAVKGDIGVGAAPRSGWSGEAIVFQRDLDGVWWEDEALTAAGIELDAIVGGKLDCEGGKVDQFGCEGIELLSFLPVSAIGGGPGSTTADIWGWTDTETGREYVLINRNDGTAFVDVTDPENPVFIGDLPMTETSVANLWRDVKTYKHYALIVADNVGIHGMQIFDLHQLRDVENPPVTFEPTVVYSEINSAHNVVVNEETGFAYIVGASDGGNTCGGALHMVDLNDPLYPTFAGCFDNPTRPSGIHDSQCVIYAGPDDRFTGREICLSSDGDMLSIADVTDKENPVQLATLSYPDEGYAHQGWLTDDQRYFFQNDEGDELIHDFGGTRTLIWDLQELDDPILTGQYISQNKSSDHNLYIRGDLMYESNYVSGLRIIDISDPEAPKEVGHLDTVPWGEDAPGFAGSWSNYPFFESGTIAVSSIREGLFLVRKTADVVP